MLPGSPPVLIVGPVTWDLVGGRRIPGGTVSYAARTAAALGVRAHILTMAAEDADLSALAGHDVCVVPSAATLTFAHTFHGGVRHLRLIAAPGRTLTPDDAPADWPPPGRILIAPLLPSDIEAPAFAAVSAVERGITGQGLLRRVSASGAISVTHEPTSDLISSLTDTTSLFLSDAEVSHWSDDSLATVARLTRRLVITRGSRGAEIRDGDGRRAVPPLPARPVDTTGAGDVFAAAFILTLGEGEATAARLAAAYAAASVEVRGAAPLPGRTSIEQRLRQD